MILRGRMWDSGRMKNGIVRFAALYVFNVAALLVIGLLLPGVSVGFNAL